ncbi:hypothetical protein DFH08DRAFT_825197 [Mycena albidolilacea]|uniref:Uncharacterized protein n=1 Tax=Mycena albidolilacea TaxID=1033008 RepID=A0AAD6Z3G1_9AGAR|nr:hypothetical protein DFH08DRAFT_825197 [Mycena albidolilacea]
MVTTPGFFVVLIHAWMVFLESKDSIRCTVWLQSMFSFTFMEEAKLHRPDSDTIEGTGGPHAPAGIDLLYGVLKFVAIFDEFRPERPSGKLPSLCAAMPGQNAVESLTLALCALTQTTAVDPGLVPDAARTGFFQAFIDAEQQRPPLHKHFRFFLAQIFASSAVYYPMLYGISEAFTEVQGQASSEAFRRSSIFEEWSMLSDIVSRRLDIMRRFDGQIDMSQRGCGDPESLNVALDVRFLLLLKGVPDHFDWVGNQSMCAAHRCMSVGFLRWEAHFCEREFLRFLLHHDYLEARSKIILDQVPIFRDNPDNMAYTVFNYMRRRVEVLTLPVAVAISVSEQTIRVDPDLWLNRMLCAVTSDERMGLHVMLLRDSEEAKLWVLPLRTNISFTRDSVAQLGSFEDGTAGFIEAAENLEITKGTVEIH